MTYHSTLDGSLEHLRNSKDGVVFEDIFEKISEIQKSECLDEGIAKLQREYNQIVRQGFTSGSKVIRSLQDIYEDTFPIKLLGSGYYGYAFLVKYCDQPAVLKITKIIEGKAWPMGEEAFVLNKLDGAGGLPKLFVASVSGDVIIMSHVTGMSFKYLMFSTTGAEHLFKVSDKVPFFLSLFQCLCVAVNEVHTAGYVHNDLHFGNIMIEGGYYGKPVKVKLIDVGFATPPGPFNGFISSSTARKYGRRFKPRELFRDHMTYPSSDVFSIGRLLQQTTEKTRLRHIPEINTLVARMTCLNWQERVSLDETVEFLKIILDKYSSPQSNGSALSLTPSTAPTPTTTSSPPPQSLHGGVSLVLHDGGTLTLPGGDFLILPAGTTLKIPGGCPVDVQTVPSPADGLETYRFVGVGDNSAVSPIINSPRDSPPTSIHSSGSSIRQSLTSPNASPEGILASIKTSVINVTRAIIDLPWWAI